MTALSQQIGSFFKLIWGGCKNTELPVHRHACVLGKFFSSVEYANAGSFRGSACGILITISSHFETSIQSTDSMESQPIGAFVQIADIGLQIVLRLCRNPLNSFLEMKS